MKKFSIIFLCLASLQCQSNQEPSVEKIDGTSRTSLPLLLNELAGLRDGETVNVEAIFLPKNEVTDDNGPTGPDSLLLRIRLQFAVPTRFQAGSFKWFRKGELFQGQLTSSSVAYYGGQGALPSMNGQFQFSIPGRGHYEVLIPSTEIARP